MRSQICDSKRLSDDPPLSTEVKSEYFSNAEPPNVASRKRRAETGEFSGNGKTSRDEPNECVQKSSGNHYTFDFYNIPCVELCKKLLGKVLVRHLEDGAVVRGRIVETEAYLGVEDKASHSYQGKKTERNTPMFMRPGTAYVYLTYGMYSCFNISSQGDGAAVLLRAVDPLEGLEHMSSRRSLARRKPSNSRPPIFKNHELCNGPAKLTISFGIDKVSCNKLDLSDGGCLYVEPGDDVPDERIVITSRIGIQSAGIEWASKPLRFYELGNASVSKRDKKAEPKIDLNNGCK